VLFRSDAALRVQQDYDENAIASFVSDVAGMPRIVTVHDVNIVPGAKPPILSMEATLKTYRYLDESESAKAKQGGGK
jgi:type IV pilus assembly protein PilO